MASRRLLHRIERDGVPGRASVDESFVYYGTPLPALQDYRKDKNELMPEWQQEVYDENGRRRFHGAFTGGFSAGYFNTVGSKEGWAPSSFRSSRTNRAAGRASRVAHFMDAEDLADYKETFQLRTTDAYSHEHEHDPFAAFGAQPHASVSSTTSQLGQRILQKMGWKPGQGIGPLVTAKRRAQLAGILGEFGVKVTVSKADTAHMFPPPDTQLPHVAPNINRHGLGAQNDALSSALEQYRSNPENDASDDNVIRLGDAAQAPPPAILPPGFVAAKTLPPSEPQFGAPSVPEGWSPDPRRVWAHAGRPSHAKPQRAAERRVLLGEPAPPGPPPVVASYLSSKTRERMERARVSGTMHLTAIRVPRLDPTTAQRALDAQRSTQFDRVQDARFRDYLESQIESKGRTPALAPGELEAQQRELDEFHQAASMFRPVSGVMASRFTSSTAQVASVDKGGLYIPTRTHQAVQDEQLRSEAAAAERKAEEERAADEQRTPAQRAARAGRYGKETRTERRFLPPALLCKRFGVPQPEVEAEEPAPVRAEHAAPPAAQDAHAATDVAFIEGDDTAITEERPPVDLFRAVFDTVESDDDGDALQQFKRNTDAPSTAPKKKSRARTGPLTFDLEQDDDAPPPVRRPVARDLF